MCHNYAQNKFMERHRTSSAFSHPEYAEWYNSLLRSFLEYNKWRPAGQREPAANMALLKTGLTL